MCTLLFSGLLCRFRGACYLHHQGDKNMMMDATSTTETSVNFHQTTGRYNPEDSHLHTCRSEELKSHHILL
jgi:hypothetical protein